MPQAAKMIEAGVNIFRMNCSHRRSGQFEEVYPRIRKHAAALGKKVEYRPQSMEQFEKDFGPTRAAEFERFTGRRVRGNSRP